MKLNSHNNPSQGKRSKKPKQKSAAKLKHNPLRTEQNKERNIAKAQRLIWDSKNKIIHTPHGTARAKRREEQRLLREALGKMEEQRHREIFQTERERLISLGVIVEKENPHHRWQVERVLH